MNIEDCYKENHLTTTMSVDVVFDESDIEEEEDEEIVSDDIEGDEDVPDESSSDEEGNEDKDSITFESDSESDSEEEDVEEDVEVGEDVESGGIDLAEFYDETPKKSAKAIFNKRKRTKPPKVAKAKRVKKKKGLDDIVIPNYLMEDVREKTSKYLSKFTSEKNSKIVEREIYNYTVRKAAVDIGRAVKKTDITKELFKKIYSLVSYEIISFITKGITYKDIITNLQSNKIGLNCDSFRNEQFNDNQETNNIENPPKVMRGIHTCSKCIKDDDRKNDPDRGKRVDWYQQQTRSCDEPSTVFCKCTDCGKKWKF